MCVTFITECDIKKYNKFKYVAKSVINFFFIYLYSKNLAIKICNTIILTLGQKKM